MMRDETTPSEEDPMYCTYTSYDSASEPIEASVPATGENADGLAAEIWDDLYEVEDPEMPISVVDLGLIYGLTLHESETGETRAEIDMTLTYTGCPARDMLQEEIKNTVERVSDVDEAEVCLVWSPEWSLEMVTEAGERDLNDFGLSV